jgi:hypothetical protein
VDEFGNRSMTVLKEKAEESFTATCDYIINEREFPKTIEAVVTSKSGSDKLFQLSYRLLIQF